MWVHVVIFVMILCALTGWKKGWISSSGIGGKDGIRLFAVVAIAGNLLGMILTLQNGGQVYPQGYRLEKEDTDRFPVFPDTVTLCEFEVVGNKPL